MLAYLGALAMTRRQGNDQDLGTVIAALLPPLLAASNCVDDLAVDAFDVRRVEELRRRAVVYSALINRQSQPRRAGLGEQLPLG